MKLNLVLNIIKSSLIVKSVVHAGEKGPESKSLSTLKESVGSGCRNSVNFYANIKAEDGSKCAKSSLCEGSHTNTIFAPHAKDTCIKFSDEEPQCSVFEVVTSFEEGWCMTHLTMKASRMDPSLDPKSFKFLASKDKLVWKELLSTEVAFQNREDKIAYTFKNKYKYHHYAMRFEKSKDVMHVGKVGLVESYTASCTADLHHKITGVSLPWYDTTASPTASSSASPTASRTTDAPTVTLAPTSSASRTTDAPTVL